MRYPILAAAMAFLFIAAAPPPVTFTDHAAQFDAFATRTQNMASDQRVADFQAEFDRIMPGLYADRDPARLKRRIAKALAEFPALRPAYLRIERDFPAAFAVAVRQFRTIFPDFVPPLPIYFVHELGVRDAGSDYVDGRKVMLFGADVIAQLHPDDSLQPFLDHELFHLEHARHFADCDPFWCLLWQEGLATYAASAMTPHATDHQLLLDQPPSIRIDTDAHWVEALCFVATRFDATDSGDIEAAFTLGGRSALPARFGYYVGLRLVTEAARSHALPVLARLDNAAARPVVVASLARMIQAAHASCAPPPTFAPKRA